MSGERAVFTEYALRRLRQRSISRDEVQAVLDAPSFDLPSVQGRSRRRLRATVAGRRISVIVRPTELSPRTVITVWDDDLDDEQE